MQHLTRYLLNSPVLTSDGFFHLAPVTSAVVTQWRSDPGLISAIGHRGAADWLAARLGRPVGLSRGSIVMQPGDEALVCCLTDCRPPHRELSAAQMEQAGCTLKLLVRAA